MAVRMPAIEHERAYPGADLADASYPRANDLIGVYAGGSYALAGYEAGGGGLDGASSCAPARRPGRGEIVEAAGHGRGPAIVEVEAAK